MEQTKSVILDLLKVWAMYFGHAACSTGESILLPSLKEALESTSIEI
jgi:hypothetical protein